MIEKVFVVNFNTVKTTNLLTNIHTVLPFI